MNLNMLLHETVSKSLVVQYSTQTKLWWSPDLMSALLILNCEHQFLSFAMFGKWWCKVVVPNMGICFFEDKHRIAGKG